MYLVNSGTGIGEGSGGLFASLINPQLYPIREKA